MSLQDKVDHAYFTRKMFMGAVLPAPLAGIGLALAEMGHTILVGHAIGTEGLAAVGFVSPLFLLAAFFVFGLSMGGAVIYANLMNEGKQEEALAIFRFFLRLAAVIGFGMAVGGLLMEDGVLTLLGTSPEDGEVYQLTKSYITFILLGIPFEILMELVTAYLRNDNADTLAITLQTISGLANLAVSAMLLLFFDWGITGCSFGFFMANAGTFAIAMGYLCLGRGQLRVLGRAASFREAFKALRLGFATSSEYIFDAIFTLAAIHLMMDLAGTEGVAVFNIIENLSLLFIFIYEFIGKTAQPLFSTFFAECNFTELHRVFRYCLLYSLLLGLLATVGVMLWPQVLDLLFGMEDIGEVGKAYYAARVFCIGTIFMGVCLLLQNYLQSEEDEKGAFLVVFMRRVGAGLPLLFLLAEGGFYVFWFVYPLGELVTLAVIWFYQRRRGERKSIPAERVYSVSFLGYGEALTQQLEAIEDFAVRWGADERKRYLLRLALEEICEEESFRFKREAVLVQLTLIAREDGIFELHFRDDGEEFDPFQLAKEALAHQPKGMAEAARNTRGIGLHMVKSHAVNFFYRSYQGFNTLTLSI
ncbi:MATE family efflux transporter [Selenomonas ruminantium]|uniref:MATE family efflux transporter n=1 Tax=Selenomonas ruminantium TaxID=971 RepID=UPI00156A1F76|nr:MATE family efflux transporter [Selenomonas ruminantium]